MTLMHRAFRGLSGSRLGVLLTAAALISGVGLVRLLGEQEEQPIEFTHNIRDAPAPVPSAVFGSGPALRPGDKICTTATQQTANVDTDCEKAGPRHSSPCRQRRRTAGFTSRSSTRRISRRSATTTSSSR